MHHEENSEVFLTSLPFCPLRCIYSPSVPLNFYWGSAALWWSIELLQEPTFEAPSKGSTASITMPDATGHPQRSYVCATPYLENAPHLPHSVTEPPDTLTVRDKVCQRGPEASTWEWTQAKIPNRNSDKIYKFIINTKIAMKALKQRV